LKPKNDEAKLGANAVGRMALQNNDGNELRDPQHSCWHVFDDKKSVLRQDNDYFWDVSV